MVLIVLLNGECIEVENATWVDETRASLVCRDALGHEWARFNRFDVEAFTANDHVADVIREEICEEEEPKAAASGSDAPEPLGPRK
jgi:hypothetical protein